MEKPAVNWHYVKFNLCEDLSPFQRWCNSPVSEKQGGRNSQANSLGNTNAWIASSLLPLPPQPYKDLIYSSLLYVGFPLFRIQAEWLLYYYLKRPHCAQFDYLQVDIGTDRNIGPSGVLLYKQRHLSRSRSDSTVWDFSSSSQSIVTIKRNKL